LEGSRGIGAVIVRRLAADGATVALTYANSAETAAETARAAEAHGRPVNTIKADSADPGAVVDAVAQTIARFGRLVILVINAGILIRGTVDMYDLADFDRMVATNVRGVFVAIQARPLIRWKVAGSLPSAAIQPFELHSPEQVFTQ
jgi:3-oxoacyl-[acyl-carrier protein] reductase